MRCKYYDMCDDKIKLPYMFKPRIGIPTNDWEPTYLSSIVHCESGDGLDSCPFYKHFEKAEEMLVSRIQDGTFVDLETEK